MNQATDRLNLKPYHLKADLLERNNFCLYVCFLQLGTAI